MRHFDLSIALDKTNQSRRIGPGFTIVELLIVVVVIAILAAVSVVAYGGISRRAEVSALKSEVREAANQIEIAKATSGEYPDQLRDSEHQLNGGLGYEYSSSATTFCLTVTSQKAKTSYFHDSSVGTSEEGKCLGHTGYDPEATGDGENEQVINIVAKGWSDYGDPDIDVGVDILVDKSDQINYLTSNCTVDPSYGGGVAFVSNDVWSLDNPGISMWVVSAYPSGPQPVSGRTYSCTIFAFDSDDNQIASRVVEVLPSDDQYLISEVADPTPSEGGGSEISWNLNNSTRIEFYAYASALHPDTAAIRISCTGVNYFGGMGFDFTGITRTDTVPIVPGLAWADYENIGDLVGYDWKSQTYVSVQQYATSEESLEDLNNNTAGYRPNSYIPYGNDYSCGLTLLDQYQNVLYQINNQLATPEIVT